LIFPTVQFALFFAVVLPLSWALMPRQRLWRPFILVASYYFYAAADWHYVFLLAGSTVVNQAAATVITRQSSVKVRKAVLIAATALDLGTLGVFKYLDFFSDSLSASLGLSLGLLHLVLPVGVSFYTFQAISYVVDVYRGRTPLAGPLDYAIYASFFPHLVAGPIVRASEFVPQLSGPRDPNGIPAARAFGLIAGGLVKKMVVADMIGTKLVEPVFGTPQAHNAAVEYVVDGESSRDRGQVGPVLPRSERRGPGRDANAVDPDERVHDLLGHSLAEVLLVLRRAHVREGQHRDRHGFGDRRSSRVRLRPGDVEPGLAPAIDQALHIRGLPPLLDVLADGGGKLGPHFEQVLHGSRGRTAFAELPVRSGQGCVHEPVAR